jgi:predicted nucleic acid-binding protein
VRVFLDANILFSAAKSDGAVRALLRLLIEGGHTCCVDVYVVAEARRNLEAKGAEALGVLDALLEHMESPAAVAGPRAPDAVDVDLSWLPEKDRPVLAAAVRLRCDALVTGDRAHFGAAYGRTFGGTTVHSPASLAQRLLA